jgi:hypothetical protein
VQHDRCGTFDGFSFVVVGDASLVDSRSTLSHPKGASLQRDLEPAEWIIDRMLPWGPDVGTRVGAIVPIGYDAYVRLFHHVEQPIATERTRWRWSEIAERSGRIMHAAVQFDRFRWPHRPQLGSLDRDEATALVRMLRSHTMTSNRCWFAIWNGYAQLTGSMRIRVAGEEPGVLAWLPRGTRRSDPIEPPRGLADAPTVSLPNREYFLYRGRIHIVPRFEHLSGVLQTPNMWWPDDRAWFVATEIDFDSTLVACSRDCADAFLRGELETLEVSAETRLDIEGDTINPK